VPKPLIREPLRRNWRSNQALILPAARQELGRNPDVTLEEIARAAAVVRRTLFGHLSGRAALLWASWLLLSLGCFPGSGLWPWTESPMRSFTSRLVRSSMMSRA
jgi:hypothetical protein